MLNLSNEISFESGSSSKQASGSSSKQVAACSEMEMEIFSAEDKGGCEFFFVGAPFILFPHPLGFLPRTDHFFWGLQVSYM